MSRLKEIAAVGAVVAILIGLPLVLWGYRQRTLYHHPASTKVIALTAVAKDGVWTQDDVVGWNYWWKKPTRTDTISVQQGDNVVLLLRSADVLHSFSIPALHLGPIEIPSGHTVELKFRADQPGTFTFLCWTVCSKMHQNLQGEFIVQGSAKEQDSW